MKLLIGQLATMTGLPIWRVASADPFEEEKAILRDRQDAGIEIPFCKGKPEERCDPGRLLSGARSIICFALPYNQSFASIPKDTRSQGAPDVLRGEISRYAWGQDYHEVFGSRLRQLVSFLKERYPDEGFYISVDTGPLIERAAARRAGLGWIGRNCCLITPEAGSWVFLGLVLTTLHLEPDPVDRWGEGFGSGCGDCDRCLKACPTGALIAPGVLDPQRCLAYVTQMKGSVPVELRGRMGRRIWGCDTCQAVCPHNRSLGGVVAIPEEFRPRRVEEARPSLNWLASMDNRSFKGVYGDTAVAWRGRKVLRRNALIAMGNAAPADALPTLAEALGDQRTDIRVSAAWALGRLAATHPPAKGMVTAVLRGALESESDPVVREEILLALGEDA